MQECSVRATGLGVKGPGKRRLECRLTEGSGMGRHEKGELIDGVLQNSQPSGPRWVKEQWHTSVTINQW